ncbi:DNA recombination protein RmuC [Pleomorphovibrio marinus]|uniref:DNA recombination protein RmuC n=1 Tax=Pleomorphovibrio marinus TaxID=2164132 RepID=UPI000E0A9FC5|nr:DNA recombination protein RmuC [Pleomorphovibrio marinus]
MEILLGFSIVVLVISVVWTVYSQRQCGHSLQEKQEQLQELAVENASLEKEVKFLKEKLNYQKQELEEVKKGFAKEFENLANRILEDKSQKFSLQNQQNIERLLAPLGKEIVAFKQRVEETYDKESKERFSLEARVKELALLNRQISDEAKNLTEALRGNSKVRGNWGEAILETILQQSGLEKGRHYVVQEFLKDDSGNHLLGPEGRKLQPDITINFPDDRKVIVDSKISLLAYERYFHAEPEKEKSRFLEEHTKAIRLHVDQLSSKQYEAYDKVLDFVIMFVPIEAAYMVALQSDGQLWEYAYKKRVLLISSSNLIAALKLISDLWVRDDQNRNALDIANRGGRLYDKFVAFVSSLEEIGKHLEKTQESYSKAHKQLHSGSGNLIRQTEQLRELGVNARSKIPEKLIRNADVSTNTPEGE